ncbi:MAG: hypothetical protein EB131_08285 [Betaproteobacteria bacterium]|nr:hypothetical protein [Betaproteobacteria bacterium]
MLGIALGVAALIIVLSVMNGFQKEVRDRMLSVLAHVELVGPGNRLSGWPAVQQTAQRHPEVVATAPFVVGQALLSRGEQVQGAAVRGIDPIAEAAVSDIGRSMLGGSLGSLKAGEFNVVLGRELARNLDVRLGDKEFEGQPHKPAMLHASGYTPTHVERPRLHPDCLHRRAATVARRARTGGATSAGRPSA